MKRHGNNTNKLVMQIMKKVDAAMLGSEILDKTEYLESYKVIKKSSKTCPEKYLDELTSIAKGMKRLEDFVNTLDSET